MKKRIIYLLLCAFSIMLVACKSNKNEDKKEVRFEIDHSIEIEIDHYHENWDFSKVIKAYQDDLEISYSDLVIQKKDNSEIKLGPCEFTVSYVLDNEEYKDTFTVQFVDNFSIIKMHILNNESIYEVKNGDPLPSANEALIDKEYSIDGYYLDNNYEKLYDDSKKVDSDLELYVKLVYQINYNKPSISKNDVVTNLNHYIDNLLEKTTDYHPMWNQESFKGRWNYIDGVFLNSIVNLYHETNKIEYKNFFINYINYYIDEQGNFIHPETKEPTGYRSGELDSVCESRILFDAYDMTGDERYLKAIHKTYEELMKMPIASGTENFSHKDSYLNQIWLDGMYMYVPFLARYAVLNKSDETFNLIKRQYEYIRNHMFDEEKKLYYHGHDTTKSIFWADSATGNSKNFWLRSNGWLLVSLVDVLEYFPEGEDKIYLQNMLKEALDGILAYKDETTNLFYQVIDKGPTAYLVPESYLKGLKNTSYGNGDATIKNYLESSGSSMIAYTALKAARMGIVSQEYEKLGLDIFEGVYGYSYKDNTLNNICITGGLGPENKPYRDGSVAYYLAEKVGSNDAKGVGPFLMAYLEYAAAKEA